MRLFAALLILSLPAAAQRPLNESHAMVAQRLIAAALNDDTGYAKLSFLCDRIGPRLAGSAALDRAIAWAAGQMKKDGLSNVVTPRVMVPHWVRGKESLEFWRRSSANCPPSGWATASAQRRRELPRKRS